jgi:WD40 repeat protein
VRTWDAASGRAEQVLAGDFGQAWSVAFRPGGGLLAAATDDHVSLWHPGTGTQAGVRLAAQQGLVLDIAFSKDGALLAAASQDGMVRIWESAASALG